MARANKQLRPFSEVISEIEEETGRDVRDVLAQYARLGYSVTMTAKCIPCTRDSLIYWVKKLGLEDLSWNTMSRREALGEDGWREYIKNLGKHQQEKQRLYTVNGETHSLREWAEIRNTSYDTLRKRIARGWDVDKALTQAIEQR